MPNDFMWNGCPNTGNLNQVLFSIFDCFPNCIRNFLSFTGAETDMPVFIAYNNKGGKTETTAPFHNFCNSVNSYYTFFKFKFIRVNTTHSFLSLLFPLKF